MAATTPRPEPVMNPEAALGFLAQASGVLAGSLDYERTLAEVARLAVPDVADWCAVDIVEADGSLRQVTSVHADPEQEALLLELRRRYRAEKGAAAGATYAILTGDPILAANATQGAEIQIRDEEADVYRRLGPKSYMIVPLTARGRTIGALTLLSTQPGRHYTEADLDFAQHLSRRFALAIDNARLYDDAERNAAMLDTLFRSVPVGLAFLDGDLHPVRANDALGALIAPDDPQLEPLAREVLETGAPALDRDIEANGRHLLVSLTPVRAVDGTTPGVGVVAIDVTERRETARRNAFLARAGEILESSLDYETTLRNIVRIAVPDIADWCAIHMVDDAGAVRMMAVAHADPERERFAWELDKRFPYTGAEEHGPVAVINTGRAEVNLEVSDELLRASTESDEQYEIARELGLRGSIVAPLRTRGRTIGAITLVAAESGRTLSQRDVELIEELARRAGLAVENAHLYTERSRIAHALQAELLPSSLPEIPGIDVAVRYRAAGELNEVGGDFYDVFECHGGDWALVIGDVSGKGAEAAAVTALARHTVRTASLQPAGPTDLLATLNNALIAQRAGSEFCTVCVAKLTRPQGGASMRLSLGGHPPALVLRAGGGVEAHGVPGTLIGVFPDPTLTEVSVDLAPGDVLLLYTDGVTEAGPVGEEIGEDGLARILSTLVGQTPEQIVAAVESAAVAAQGGQPRDDIALVALRVDG